jgi:hypothetical protein
MKTVLRILLLMVFISAPVMAQQQPVAPEQQQPTKPVGRKLTGEEVKKLIPMTLKGDDGQYIYRHTFKEGGKLDGGSSFSGGSGQERAWDSGTWRIVGDDLCRKFDRWDSQERCRAIEVLPNGLYRNLGGRSTFTITK